MFELKTEKNSGCSVVKPDAIAIYGVDRSTDNFSNGSGSPTALAMAYNGYVIAYLKTWLSKGLVSHSALRFCLTFAPMPRLQF